MRKRIVPALLPFLFGIGAWGQSSPSARVRSVLGDALGSDASFPAPPPPPASAPAGKELTRDVQEALNALRRAARRSALATDGEAGPATAAAVRSFQRKNGLPPTGAPDDRTRAALFSAYQAKAGLAVTGVLDDATQEALPYYAGKTADFAPDSAQRTVRNALTTIYHPFLAKTAKERRMEGPTHDRYGQTICTLEKHLAGACPYVSVAIDPRLRVPDGTPLRIPEIDALAGRPVAFRIVDSGSTRYFQGVRHVDVATDSDDAAGFGRAISGRRFTLVLPRGLRPSL